MTSSSWLRDIVPPMCTKTAWSSKSAARESTLRSAIQRHFVLERLTISCSRGAPCAALDVTMAPRAMSAPSMCRFMVCLLHDSTAVGAVARMTIQRIRGTILQAMNELAQRIARRVTTEGTVEVAPGLLFYRFSAPAGPAYAVSKPRFCVIAQGSKEVVLGTERYRYDAARYLLVSAGLPLVGHVIEASKDQPYLALGLPLDPAVVTAVLVGSGLPVSRENGDVRAVAVSRLDANLLDAVVRLVRLLHSPTDYAVLAPLVVREIVYRLLIGEQGDRLRQVAVIDGRAHGMAKAIEIIGKDRKKPLRVSDIARQLGVSVSG